MPDKKITPQELKAALNGDIDRLVKQVAQAINNAQPGRIINDSEEPVRDANGSKVSAAVDVSESPRIQPAAGYLLAVGIRTRQVPVEKDRLGRACLGRL